MELVQFLAIALTALALVPGGAHLLELPNKIGLDREAYMAVQPIYRGWALVGVILVGALIADLVLAILSRPQMGPFLLASAAFLLLAATLAIFFIRIFPVNKATGNWTAAPANWAALRARWEYSHAVNAVLTFLALCAVTASSVMWQKPL